MRVSLIEKFPYFKTDPLRWYVFILSVAFGTVWFSIQNIGVDCDTPAYVQIGNYFRYGLSGATYDLTEYTLWTRSAGYPFILYLTGASYKLGLHFIVFFQFFIALILPLLIFETIRQFNRKCAFIVTLILIATFQPFLWSKVILTDFAHIFLTILNIFVCINIVNKKVTNQKIIFFILINIFGTFVRPTFVIITLISFIFIFLNSHKSLSTKITMIAYPFLLCFVHGLYSLHLSFNLPMQSKLANGSVKIGLNKYQELFLYDLFLNKKFIQNSDSDIADIRLISKNANKSSPKILANFYPNIFNSIDSDNEKLQNLFGQPTHMKYKLFREFLIFNNKSEKSVNLSEIVNNLILKNYVYQLGSLIKFLYKYSTAYAHTLNASSYLEFNKKITETPFGIFERINGPYSQKLYNILQSFFTNHSNEEIRAIVGTNIDKFKKGWLQNDQRIFRDNLEWMQLFIIVNQYLGPPDAAKLVKKVNSEIKWTVTDHGPKNIYNVPTWVPSSSEAWSFINLGLMHMYYYHIRPFKNNFGFHWNFVFCADMNLKGKNKASAKQLSSGFRLIESYKPVEIHNPYTSRTYRDNFDLYLHQVWEIGRVVFIVLVGLFLLGLLSNKLQNKRYLIFLLSLIIFHSWLENFTSGSHVRYVDHTYIINWVFCGILISEFLKIPKRNKN